MAAPKIVLESVYLLSVLEMKGANSCRNPPATGKPWIPADVSELKQLANGNTPTRVIGLKLGRTAAAIYGKASEEDVSLAPTNQSPYGTKKR